MAPSATADIQVGPAPVSVKYTKLFIDGQFVDAVSGKTFETLDPRNGELIANVAEADKEDVDIAVQVARKAFDEGPWPRLSGYERGRILFKFADLLEQHADELAALETLDNGKPVQLARFVDVAESIKLVRVYAGYADKISGRTVRMSSSYQGHTLLEPIGVVGQIIPWNFPLVMVAMKVGPALACGNTVILKPAEQTPLTALYAAQLAKEAGLPPGVLNVLPGFGPTAGAAIANHNGIDKVAFTGSTEVGREVMIAAAKSNLKPVSLELGGKSPLIILDDADLDLAVTLSHLALFFNQGQVCCAGSRIFVQEGLYNTFLERITELAKKRVIGDPFQGGVDHGPLIDQIQLERVVSYIESGKKEGANLVIGGSQIGSKGYYLEPTIFADVQDNMKIAEEEIFGPVMSILKFKSLEEIVQRANNTRYGLAAGIVTKNIDVASRLSRSIRAGTIWINCYHVLDPSLPFGGYKMSGIGRENGEYALQNYLQVKAVVSPLVDSPWL
ncbi:hypothetical protein O6H91_10G002000 [Diphasiastrum complanatum]|uniref:Uncharacterized protein n=19 Tax=Diphasiastrum complanatum TaxID=34168 RepID=A0ACC2CDZ7_DIPCM|nr:hypothetical protein O6H91_Y207600 [Diphasiastrum complanatum]KAJ7295192.1 hypothetical protein O6H91_Y207600 [Diphasiastrum complanatum]KAJ7295193.1 hypothetical protein O6H91_Y207600 [Diphasiastrum complanatum]KAJ7295194.1 hypothetical protein O6H91_Y207600 [Diphasiastrum complanatum]KAJ7295195.1 hypothetical protein O6H91_Y207600 [Diphasiastrum complanatum]